MFFMDNILSEQALDYIHSHVEENINLLSELGRIPAPSHQEDKRGGICKILAGGSGGQRRLY